MVYAVPEGGFTVDDLDWLRDEIGVAHLELDPWGSLIVSPASDEHETAVSILWGQAFRQLDLPDGCIYGNGLAWTVPGGSDYLMLPDLAIIGPGWRRVEELHLDPPPMLVLEVGSRSTWRVDRTRKLSDYRLGGAGVYVLVDLGPEVTFEAHVFATGEVVVATGAIDLVVGGQPLRFELASPS